MVFMFNENVVDNHKQRLIAWTLNRRCCKTEWLRRISEHKLAICLCPPFSQSHSLPHSLLKIFLCGFQSQQPDFLHKTSHHSSWTRKGLNGVKNYNWHCLSSIFTDIWGACESTQQQRHRNIWERWLTGEKIKLDNRAFKENSTVTFNVYCAGFLNHDMGLII